MLNADFDFTGRLIAVRFASKGQDSQNFTATGKYFITLGKTIKTRNGYGTLYHDFIMWNSKNSSYQAVKGFTTHVGIGDVTEVAGRFTPKSKDQNGNWYDSEDCIYNYRRIARSFKHQEQANERFAQQGSTTTNNNMFGNNNQNGNNSNNMFGNNGQQQNNDSQLNNQQQNNGSQPVNRNTRQPNNKASNNRKLNHAPMNKGNRQPSNNDNKKLDISGDNLPF